MSREIREIRKSGDVDRIRVQNSINVTRSNPSQLEQPVIVYIQLMTQPLVTIKLGARAVLRTHPEGTVRTHKPCPIHGFSRMTKPHGNGLRIATWAIEAL